MANGYKVGTYISCLWITTYGIGSLISTTANYPIIIKLIIYNKIMTKKQSKRNYKPKGKLVLTIKVYEDGWTSESEISAEDAVIYLEEVLGAAKEDAKKDAKK